MKKHHRKTNRSGFVLLMVVFLVFGSAPGTSATICDDDPGAVPFFPTVNPELLDGVLATLGVVPLEDVVLEATFVYENFEHTATVVLNGDMDIGVDFMVVPALGSIEVVLTIPAWQADMYITLEHKPCRNCVAEWNECRPTCNDIFDVCMYYCTTDPSCCCNGDLDCCTNFQCAFERDACLASCDFDKAGCDFNVGFCRFERDFLDAFIDEHQIGMSYAQSTVTQVADVCVTGSCRALAPHASTNVNLVNYHIEYFPEDPRDTWGIIENLNNMITEFSLGEANPEDIIADMVVDEDRGVALLVSAFGLEIMNDGCAPAAEVQACRGGACSIGTSSDLSARKGASILLYSLPLIVMGGLILWRRRK